MDALSGRHLVRQPTGDQTFNAVSKSLTGLPSLMILCPQGRAVSMALRRALASALD